MSAQLRRQSNELVERYGPERVISALAPIMAEERRARLDEVVAGRLGGVMVALENLHDPHNGGAALRSCEAFGLLHVAFVGQPLKMSERVTQGCEKWLEIEEPPSVDVFVREAKARGYRLCAAVPSAKIPLESLDPTVPTAFLMGNEHEGLSATARAACDVEIALTMHGFSESVNLSVATALLVYTHTRRRREALGRAGDLSEEETLRLRAAYYARSVDGAAAIVARAATEARRG